MRGPTGPVYRSRGVRQRVRGISQRSPYVGATFIYGQWHAHNVCSVILCALVYRNSWTWVEVPLTCVDTSDTHFIRAFQYLPMTPRLKVSYILSRRQNDCPHRNTRTHFDKWENEAAFLMSYFCLRRGAKSQQFALLFASHEPGTTSFWMFFRDFSSFRISLE